MSGLIAVVCRHNQARSVMAAAALKRFFPTAEVFSAGVAAVEGQRIPQSILNLAESWGLDVGDLFSHSLEGAQEQLLLSDFVIVAEDDFIPNLLDLGVNPKNILSMQDKRFAHELIPFDPIGQGRQVVSVEITKAVMTSVQLYRQASGFRHDNPVKIYFAFEHANYFDQLEIAWRTTRDLGGVLLLADFRAPDLKSVSSVCDKVLELTIDRVDKSIAISDSSGAGALQRALDSGEAFAISGRFEMDQVEKFVLSAQFIELVSKIAASRPLKILTEPTGLAPLAFLLAAQSDM